MIGKLKVVYFHGLLSVFTREDQDYIPCGSLGIPVSLPTQYFFSISASTGIFYDNHDAVSFKYYSLQNFEAQSIDPASISVNDQEEEGRIQPSVAASQEKSPEIISNSTPPQIPLQERSNPTTPESQLQAIIVISIMMYIPLPLIHFIPPGT
jgi:hypothetical protein